MKTATADVEQRYSHDRELSRLYRSREALLELDARGSLDPAFVTRHLRRVNREIDWRIAVVARARRTRRGSFLEDPDVS